MENKLLEPINDMLFLTPNDLYNKIDDIKQRYYELDKDYKNIYKWFFFYQLCLLKDTKDNPVKSNLWSYINGVISKDTLNLSYFQFVRCQKKIEIDNAINSQLSLEL